MSLEKLFPLEMDKPVIRSGGSKPPETAKEPEKRTTKAQRDKKYGHKRTRLFKDSWFANFTWLQKEDSSDTLYCHVCRMFLQIYLITACLYATRTVSTEKSMLVE